jgi:folylpolyglutamate synthase/dihydropteroate synthase
MMRDKNTHDILKEIKTFASAAVFTETSNGRSMAVNELCDEWHGLSGAPPMADDGMNCTDIAAPDKAYAKALRVAEDFDALVVCGSLYLISDLLTETER